MKILKKCIETFTKVQIKSHINIHVVALTLFSYFLGEYTCFYQQKSNESRIIHKASAVMDVCLLPNIKITSIPSFPHCEKDKDLLNLRVECQIKSSNETYNVTWTKQGISADLREKTGKNIFFLHSFSESSCELVVKIHNVHVWSLQRETFMQLRHLLTVSQPRRSLK